MEHALHLPNFRALTVALIAAVLGAGAATAGYALIDSDAASPSSPSKVVVIDSSGEYSTAQPSLMSGRRP
jgi:hypothetical protein